MASSEVADFLHSAGLGCYAPQFEAQGYDSMDILKYMDEGSLTSIIKKPGHAFKFRLRLAEAVLQPSWDKHGSTKASYLQGTNGGSTPGGGAGIPWFVKIWMILVLVVVITIELLFWDIATETAAGAAAAAAPSQPQHIGGDFDAASLQEARVEALQNVTDSMDALIINRVYDAFEFNEDSLDRQNFYHLHIPKVGGASFRKEVPRILATSVVFETLERCYYDAQKKDKHVLTLLRRPRKHALSQYTHCATSASHLYGQEWMPGQFDNWVFGWHWLRNHSRRSAFCCSNPIDMQAYRMTCPAGSMSSGKQKRHFNEVHLEEAIHNVKEAFFIGILEAYDESICLLQFRVRGRLPPYCNCDDPEAWNRRPKLHKDSHLVKRSTRIEDLPKETLEVLDLLTARDTIIYNVALKRFLTEVRIVERHFRRRFLCKDIKFLAEAKPVVRSQQWLDGIFKKVKRFTEEMPWNFSHRGLCAARYGNLTHASAPPGE